MAIFETLPGSTDCWWCSSPGADLGPFHIVKHPQWGSGQQSIWLCRWMRLHRRCLEEMRRGAFDGVVKDEPQCQACTLAAPARQRSAKAVA
jgi:hypothetical protein